MSLLIRFKSEILSRKFNLYAQHLSVLSIPLLLMTPVLSVISSANPLVWWWAPYSIMAAVLVVILELPILARISSITTTSNTNTTTSIIARLSETFNEYLFKGTLHILISLSLWTSLLGFVSFLIIPSLMLSLSGAFYIISIWKGEEKEDSFIRMVNYGSGSVDANGSGDPDLANSV